MFRRHQVSIVVVFIPLFSLAVAKVIDNSRLDQPTVSSPRPPENSGPSSPSQPATPAPAKEEGRQPRSLRLGAKARTGEPAPLPRGYSTQNFNYCAPNRGHNRRRFIVESRPKSCLFACSAAREAACWASRAAKSDAWLFGSRLGGGKRLISLCSLGFYLRPLGGQAGGICGIIRNQSGKRRVMAAFDFDGLPDLRDCCAPLPPAIAGKAKTREAHEQHRPGRRLGNCARGGEAVRADVARVAVRADDVGCELDAAVADDVTPA